VAGAGPVGLAAAVALAGAGFSVALAGALPETGDDPLDPRTFALFEPALTFLDRLGLWPMPPGTTAPLEAIRLIDDTGHLLRAPDTLFEAREINLAAFGHNIPHATLAGALASRVQALAPTVRRLESPVASLMAAPDHVRVGLASGDSVNARLLVGADGRTSDCRRLAGMQTRGWSYPQAAMVASLRHSRPHGGVSTELHRLAGPLTIVPLPGNASSIVWVERPEEAERIALLGTAAFARLLHERLQGILGRIEAEGPRRVFPLEGLIAEPAAERRVALVGEALHAFPPIGAQGLNLGFRDVASLIDAATDARSAGFDIGAAQTLAAYARSRRGDVRVRTLMVDMLDRTLFADLLSLQLARGAALHIVNAVPGLRRMLMRRGMGPVVGLPRMMRQ
jgi:2-octaprenyl-6-methoxyphenol hydroxylase